MTASFAYSAFILFKASQFEDLTDLISNTALDKEYLLIFAASAVPRGYNQKEKLGLINFMADAWNLSISDVIRNNSDRMLIKALKDLYEEDV